MDLKLFSFLTGPTKAEGTAFTDVQRRTRYQWVVHRYKSRLAFWNTGYLFCGWATRDGAEKASMIGWLKNIKYFVLYPKGRR